MTKTTREAVERFSDHVECALDPLGASSLVRTIWAEKGAAEARAFRVTTERNDLEARIAELEAAVIGTASSLAAAISLLERGGKAAKKAAPSDKMFDQMLTDYSNALSHARAALAQKGE